MIADQMGVRGMIRNEKDGSVYIEAEGDDVSLELESDLGVTKIGGVTTLATFHIGNPGVNGMNNQQGGVRYSWDGQEAYGMIERSAPAELCRIV